TSLTSVLVGSSAITIGRSATMRGIVLPIAAATLPGSVASLGGPVVNLISIARIDVVSVEIVVVVDRDVSAAVPIAITPTTSPRRPHRDASPESKRSITHRSGVRVRISRCRSVNNGRTVLGNINRLRIGWLNLDHLVTAFDRLGLDFL